MEICLHCGKIVEKLTCLMLCASCFEDPIAVTAMINRDLMEKIQDANEQWFIDMNPSPPVH